MELEEKLADVILRKADFESQKYFIDTCKQCVEIAEEFAIGFKVWCDNTLFTLCIDGNYSDGTDLRSVFDMLQEYKQHLKTKDNVDKNN